MTITPFLFEAFLKFPTKCWLRFTGEPPAGNAYAEWVATEHESDCADAAKRLISNAPAADCAVAPLAENLKTAKWRVAVDVPVRIVLRSSRGHEAQTCIAENRLSLLTSAATILEIIHGDGHATLKVKTGARTALSARTFVTSYGLADIAVRAPLAPGQRVHERERAPETLGDFTVTQLSYTFRPCRRPKRLRDKAIRNAPKIPFDCLVGDDDNLKIVIGLRPQFLEPSDVQPNPVLDSTARAGSALVV